MYSESEIDEAVAAGALDHEAAERLRLHVSRRRESPAVDEEQFRLVTGFNDVFVSIAAVLVLVAAGTLGGAILVAAASWGLAEFFTRRRRMALPSIILTVTFVTSIFAICVQLLGARDWFSGGFANRPLPVIMAYAASGMLAAAAASLHWRRFKVPIAVACGTVATVVAVMAVTVTLMLMAMDRDTVNRILPWMAFATGLAMFAFAMRWDMSDLRRTTRRSDVAFWLHLAASPLIVHPLFLELGVLGVHSAAAPIIAVAAIGLYVVLGVVALAVDRRALLVSALVYVLAAMAVLLRSSSTGATTFAVPAAVIGGLLLALSAFWRPLRATTVGMLPLTWRTRLPVVAASA